MTILFQCTCGRTFQVKEEFAGRRARCANCGVITVVPQPPEPEVAKEDALRVLLADELSRRSETEIREEEPVREPLRPPQMPRSLREDPEPFERSKPLRPKLPRQSRASVAINPSIVTGLLMMLGAAVWFFVGLSAGIIFFYPPILFVLGIGTMIKGFAGGD